MQTKKIKIIALISITIILTVGILSVPTSALLTQNATSWYWTSDTNVSCVAVGDVNGDGRNEIVTAGWYNTGSVWVALLAVWNASNLALINVKSWNWNDTQISSVAIGDVNGDGQNEIVTGGEYYTGSNWAAQLCVWNGISLANLGVKVWYWYNDTQISSVAVANITGTAGLSIVTGGSFSNGTNIFAQVCTWNGISLALQGVTTWTWGNYTYVNSVAVADINGTGVKSIVTGGTYFDGTRNIAQVVEWNATNLAYQNVATWYWTSNTEVTTIAVANVTGGSALTIVTGGSYFDGTRYVSQLVKWNGASLAFQAVNTWYWYGDTKINSLTVGNYTGGNSLDIVTAGSFVDPFRMNALLAVWNGTTLASFSSAGWYTTAATSANAVVIANGGLGNRIYSAGSFFDTLRSNAQIAQWV
jgi:hypothetical protein